MTSKIVVDNLSTLGAGGTIEVESGITLDTSSATHIQIPVGTTENRPKSPSIGQIRYNRDYKTLEYSNGTSWIVIEKNNDYDMVSKDGLVMHLDAETFTDGSRTWFDLSGVNNNAQLRGWTSYSTTTQDNVKCFHFTGSTAGSGDMTISGGNTGVNGGSNFYGNYVGGDATHTFEFWAYYPGTGGFDPFNSGSCGSACIAYGESRFYYDVSGGRPVHAGIVSGEWHQYVVVQNGGYVRSYRDGKRIDPSQESYGTSNVSTRTDWVTPTATDRPGIIGSRGWANRAQNWYLSSMLWYDRELTEEEIYNNFAAKAARHGLTAGAIESPSLITNGLRLHLDSENSAAELTPGAGGTWTDRTGNGYNGILQNNPGYWPTYYNGILSFNGSNQWVQIDNFASQISGSMTFQVWVNSNYTNPTTRGEVLISAHSGTSNRLRWQIDDNFIFISDITDGADTKYYHDRLTPGTWHNYALRIDSDRNIITMYLDGKPLRSIDNFAGWGASIDRFSIGQEWDTNPSEYINGYLSEVYAYNRRLEDWEILQNYNATRGRYDM